MTTSHHGQITFQRPISEVIGPAWGLDQPQSVPVSCDCVPIVPAAHHAPLDQHDQIDQPRPWRETQGFVTFEIFGIHQEIVRFCGYHWIVVGYLIFLDVYGYRIFPGHWMLLDTTGYFWLLIFTSAYMLTWIGIKSSSHFFFVGKSSEKNGCLIGKSSQYHPITWSYGPFISYKY